MLRTLVVVLTASLAASCGGEGARGPEGYALDACKSEVERRTGEALADAERPWRITSRDEAGGYVVSIWTDVAEDAPRPTGVPDYVCVTKRDSDAENGIRLVEVRP